MGTEATKICVEVTGNIVVAAIQNGLVSGGANDIAAFFNTIYLQVYKSGLMQPANFD